MIIKTVEQLSEYLTHIRQQAESMIGFGKSVKITMELARKLRSQEQNRYMWAVFENIANFYQDTGFIPDGLQSQIKIFNKDIAKVWFSAKYGIKHTSYISTKEMANFLDNVQRDMLEQSQGEYNPIYPEEIYTGGRNG